jgi:hypothetical protein
MSVDFPSTTALAKAELSLSAKKLESRATTNVPSLGVLLHYRIAPNDSGIESPFQS